MPAATCGVCGRQREIDPVKGAFPDLPPGWASVTVAVRPAVNRVLCRRHLGAVLAALGIPRHG
jgi:hypothetical protein